jgi:hypothetical protein
MRMNADFRLCTTCAGIVFSGGGTSFWASEATNKDGVIVECAHIRQLRVDQDRAKTRANESESVARVGPTEVVRVFRYTVNGAEYATSKDFISYDQISDLAGCSPGEVITILFSMPNEEKRMLVPGQTIIARDGLRFSAASTNNA